MRRLLVGSLALAMAAAVTPLRAQQSGSGDGFWVSGGLGSGWARVGCDICQSDRGTALSGYLGVGGRLSAKVFLGAEGNGWTSGEGQLAESVWGLSAVAYVYPNPRRGFFWKGGVGLLSYTIDDQQNQLSSTAFGVQAGVGYAFPVHPRVAVTPYVSAFLASFGSEVKFNGAEILDHSNLSLIQAGVGVTRR